MAGRSYTRQLTTILSVDAVGYSRLMGLSDELALERLEERRAVIAHSCNAAGGRMFGVAGDSMMAEFGAPVDAVRAALDFQDRIEALEAPLDERERLPFRAGINTGDVIVRDDALFGDEVNIAARLQEIAAPGGVVVSATTYHHVAGRLAAEFLDLGERALKNIGIRVQAYAVSRTGAPIRSGAPGGPAPSASRSSIAVLPFTAENGDLDLSILADGIAEDIIIGLSNTRWLPVIAKSSSFQFRDAALGSIRAGHALGARYVVSGSLARAGDQLRLKAVLEDTATALVLWSKRFDHPLDAMSELQQGIGNEIVAVLEKQVDRAEQVRAFRAPWEQAETWSLVQRGRWHMQRRSREDTRTAFELFMQAFATDPNSSMVLDELTWWHAWRAWLLSGESDELDKVSLYARRALFMDSQDARPHAYLGIAAILRGQARPALEHLDEALRLNPSFAIAHSATGTAHILLGDSASAIPRLLEANRLSPFDPYGFHNFGELAAARLLEGDAEGALAAAQRSLELSPRYIYAGILRIAALWTLGRHVDACAARTAFRVLQPDFVLDRGKWIPFVDRAIIDRLVAGYAATDQCADDGRAGRVM